MKILSNVSSIAFTIFIDEYASNAASRIFFLNSLSSLLLYISSNLSIHSPLSHKKPFSQLSIALLYVKLGVAHVGVPTIAVSKYLSSDLQFEKTVFTNGTIFKSTSACSYCNSTKV